MKVHESAKHGLRPVIGFARGDSKTSGPRDHQRSGHGEETVDPLAHAPPTVARGCQWRRGVGEGNDGVVDGHHATTQRRREPGGSADVAGEDAGRQVLSSTTMEFEQRGLVLPDRGDHQRAEMIGGEGFRLDRTTDRDLGTDDLVVPIVLTERGEDRTVSNRVRDQ